MPAADRRWENPLPRKPVPVLRIATLHAIGIEKKRPVNAPQETPTPELSAIGEWTSFVTRILGKIISDGEFSGNTILLRIGDTIGEISGITITLPSAWDYTSCLGAVSSGIVNTDPLHHSRLDEFMLGLIGSEITGFQMNPTNVILQCGSIRIEKRLSNREDAFEIIDHDRKIRFRMSPRLCVEKFFC